MTNAATIILTGEQIIAALIAAEPAVYKQVEDWVVKRKQTEAEAVAEMRAAGSAAVDAFEATVDAVKSTQAK